MSFPQKRAGLSWIVLVCTLVAGQSVFVGRFSSESGATSNTVYIAEGAYTFKMNDTYGDGICCQYGAGKFKMTVHGEPVAICSSSSSREFRDVVRESIDVVGRSTHRRLPVGTIPTRMGRAGR
jgi:hypothetical protein